MAELSTWRTRPVFVFSTFRSPYSERDWLANRVTPELEERLRERRYGLFAKRCLALGWPGMGNAAIADHHQSDPDTASRGPEANSQAPGCCLAGHRKTEKGIGCTR